MVVDSSDAQLQHFTRDWAKTGLDSQYYDQDSNWIPKCRVAVHQYGSFYFTIYV